MTAFADFCRAYCRLPAIGLSLDWSRMGMDDAFFERMAAPVQRAFQVMRNLEAGAIANPDENRMVGHYWLRAPRLAPTAEIAGEIERTVERVKEFVGGVHRGEITGPSGKPFTRVLSIGIGGSALGPMLAHDALGDPATDRMKICFFDNTDPDGIARTLAQLQADLAETLVIVISKSGGTPETRNGMLLAAEAFANAGLPFARHAVAVTGVGSKLDQQAVSDNWLARFPMWDWVGGRTSETSAVGLLPAALQGIDIDAMLAGAAACDEATRNASAKENPAMLLALAWYCAGNGRGERQMVVLPYKDRLLLMSRYLQQLVMESLGKRLDLEGNVVEQGLTVYGNKGSTDQHAYVQQLRDGLPNFFVTFIRVLHDGGSSLEVEPGITAGDYLHGLLLGTREALAERERPTLTVTIERVDAYFLGVLIALFERAVGYYASLIGVNAYNQPGVEAGKTAAAGILALSKEVAAALSTQPCTADEIAAAIGSTSQSEIVQFLLEHLAANGQAVIEGDERTNVTPRYRWSR